MTKEELAIEIFSNQCNCSQAVLGAYAGDFGITRNQALSLAAGFGAGMGRNQDVCGAVSGAIIVLGLKSDFREGEGRPKINAVYDEVRNFTSAFTKEKGSIKCRELLDGCDLSTEEGQKRFKEQNLRESCFGFVRLACRLLDTNAGKS